MLCSYYRLIRLAMYHWRDYRSQQPSSKYIICSTCVYEINCYMASRSNLMERYLTNIVRREELNALKKFKVGKDIHRHLCNIEQKFEELDIPVEEQAKLIFNSVEEVVQQEIQMQMGFKANKKNQQWMKEKLIVLYESVQSPVHKMVDLLHVKQQSGQKLREFVRELRIAAWRIMADTDEERREAAMLMAFTNGLRNSKCAMVIRQLQPKTKPSIC